MNWKPHEWYEVKIFQEFDQGYTKEQYYRKIRETQLQIEKDLALKERRMADEMRRERKAKEEEERRKQWEKAQLIAEAVCSTVDT